MADDPTNEDPTAEPEPDDKPADPPAPPPAKDDDKGEIPPALKSILDKERRAARDADKRAKAAESELAKIREAQMTEQEKAVKAARDEGLTEGASKGNARLLRAEVLAAASGKVADPDDAYAILSSNGTLNDFAVNEDGEIDRVGLKTAIDELVKAKPHLASTRAPEFGTRPPATPAGSSDAGMDAWLRAQTGRV